MGGALAKENKDKIIELYLTKNLTSKFFNIKSKLKSQKKPKLLLSSDIACFSDYCHVL